ncbi:MAG TPA: hypothetical protein DIC60_03460 [Lachnospiraceae bacterium]|nr:hypothetical protein [Lachnospiraceae bacterium]
MNGFSEFLNQNLLSLVVVLAILVVSLFAVSVIAFMSVIKLQKRYEVFTGGKRRPEYNIEYQFKEFHAAASKMEQRYETLAELVRDMDKNMAKCVQKVGVIRYNPFDEMGGNLCYAVALLDTDNNGVVFNGIHSRTGSFTYSKPIQLGVSEYVLSEEEKKAVEMAIVNGYTPESRLEILDELEKRVPLAYGKKANDVPLEPLSEEEKINLKDILTSAGAITSE